MTLFFEVQRLTASSESHVIKLEAYSKIILLKILYAPSVQQNGSYGGAKKWTKVRKWGTRAFLRVEDIKCLYLNV